MNPDENHYAEIPFIPGHLKTEANFQAEFFHQCRLLRLNCVLEVTVPVGRCDLLVFSDDWSRLLAIVECKRYNHGHMTRQLMRYKSLGVPVHVLASIDSKALAISIKESPFQGILWSVIKTLPKLTRSRPKERRKHRRIRDRDGHLQNPFHPNYLDEDLNYKSS